MVVKADFLKTGTGIGHQVIFIIQNFYPLLGGL